MWHDVTIAWIATAMKIVLMEMDNKKDNVLRWIMIFVLYVHVNAIIQFI